MLARLIKLKPTQLNISYAQSSFFSLNNGGNNPKKDEPYNPYYNPTASGMKSELNEMSDKVQQWQHEFKKKHGRKPTLEEMKSDPAVSGVLGGIDKQKNAIVNELRKFR